MNTNSSTDSKADNVAFLKSACNLKRKIDNLVQRRNHDEIDEQEIMRVRKSIEKILRKYPSRDRCDAIDDSKCAKHSRCDQRSANPRVKEIFDISSNFCADIDTIKNNLKKKISDKRECHKVTREDCNANKRQTDLHETCEQQMQCYEKYIKKLECRMQEVISLLRDQQSDQKPTLRESCLENTISTLKKKLCRYKSKVRRLTEQLDFANKTLVDRRRRTDETVCKIEQLKLKTEKNATDLSELVKSLSSVAVDLSLSRGQPPPSDDQCDDDDDDLVVSSDDDLCEIDGNASEAKNKGLEQDAEVETSCCRPAAAAAARDGRRSFSPPIVHSTPTHGRSRVEEEDDWQCSNVVGWADDFGGDRSAKKITEKSSPTTCDDKYGNVETSSKNARGTMRTLADTSCTSNYEHLLGKSPWK